MTATVTPINRFIVGNVADSLLQLAHLVQDNPHMAKRAVVVIESHAGEHEALVFGDEAISLSDAVGLLAVGQNDLVRRAGR